MVAVGGNESGEILTEQDDIRRRADALRQSIRAAQNGAGRGRRSTLADLDKRVGAFCEEVLALDRADARQFAPILERLIGELDNLHEVVKRQWQRYSDKLATLESLQGGNG